MVNIIAEKYKDFKKFYPENKNNFLEAKPFPYIELNNFFNEDYLNQILDNFPKMSENKHDFKRNTKAEVKLGIGSPEKIPKKINLFIEYLNSYFFLDFLQKLTGIKQRLIPDPYLFGAGLHEIKKGGFLKIHSDFNVHPQLNLNRRLNLLLYLNKDWKEEWGGHLELWDRDMKSCKVKISPNFNKLVIFNTTDYSFHGHPNPLACPEDVTRKSLALYYYTNGRPSNEINPALGESGQTTLYQKREGFEDDFVRNRIEFKKIFGKFYIRKRVKY
tara:strand:- start:255 stop:1073 length:819 start_codon:yes stop_codon:yes gene_type:complete